MSNSNARQIDRTSLQTLDGDVQVLCTFEYSAAEPADEGEPGCAAWVCVTGVAINGHEVNAAVFHAEVIAAWEEDILREVLDGEADDRTSAAVERFLAARDDSVYYVRQA